MRACWEGFWSVKVLNKSTSIKWRFKFWKTVSNRSGCLGATKIFIWWYLALSVQIFSIRASSSPACVEPKVMTKFSSRMSKRFCKLFFSMYYDCSQKCKKINFLTQIMWHWIDFFTEDDVAIYLIDSSLWEAFEWRSGHMSILIFYNLFLDWVELYWFFWFRSRCIMNRRITSRSTTNRSNSRTESSTHWSTVALFCSFFDSITADRTTTSSSTTSIARRIWLYARSQKRYCTITTYRIGIVLCYHI